MITNVVTKAIVCICSLIHRDYTPLKTINPGTVCYDNYLNALFEQLKQSHRFIRELLQWIMKIKA